ncbi:Coiled-coil domain-containing protein 28B [Halotydeus destructor]|nr:Coiled-coil domain-containing protein 28B [Halotydeus destructor]
MDPPSQGSKSKGSKGDTNKKLAEGKTQTGKATHPSKKNTSTPTTKRVRAPETLNISSVSSVQATRSSQLVNRNSRDFERTRPRMHDFDHQGPSREPLPQNGHTFLSDVTDVQQMEQGLLQLLEDFHGGKLQAFGQDITFEKMESVREQQEKLARLHFELHSQQEIYGHDTKEGRTLAKENMLKLMENLQQLSNSIEQLQLKFSGIESSNSTPGKKRDAKFY